MQKSEAGPVSHQLKSTQDGLKDLNIRPETIKLLEESTAGKLLDTSLGDYYYFLI